MDLHDPQVANGDVKHWLDCIQFNNERRGLANVNVHVDGSRETKRAIVHQGEFGPNALGMMSSYESFKGVACNYLSCVDQDALISKQGFLPFLMITKIMLDALERSTFPFVPTHVFYDRACMILQEKYFFVPSSVSSAGGTFVLEICDKDNLAALKNNCTMSSTNPGYTVVRATEIAFGSPGSSFALDPPAIWFDIPQDAIKKASISRIKITTSRTKCNTDGNVHLVPLRRFLTERYQHGGPLCHWGPFCTFYSDREDMRQLISETVNFKIRELMLLSTGTCEPLPHQYLTSTQYEGHLESTFNAIKDEHLRYGWPVNEGRNVHDLDIPAPDADSPYCIACNDVTNEYDFARRIYSSFSSVINTDTTSTDVTTKTFDFHSSSAYDNTRTSKHDGAAGSNCIVPVHLPKICSYKCRLEPLFAASFDDEWEKVKAANLRETCV